MCFCLRLFWCVWLELLRSLPTSMCNLDTWPYPLRHHRNQQKVLFGLLHSPTKEKFVWPPTRNAPSPRGQNSGRGKNSPKNLKNFTLSREFVGIAYWLDISLVFHLLMNCCVVVTLLLSWCLMSVELVRHLEVCDATVLECADSWRWFFPNFLYFDILLYVPNFLYFRHFAR
jgi:hypothetical protein